MSSRCSIRIISVFVCRSINFKLGNISRVNGIAWNRLPLGGYLAANPEMKSLPPFLMWVRASAGTHMCEKKRICVQAFFGQGIRAIAGLDALGIGGTCSAADQSLSFISVVLLNPAVSLLNAG
jgi:hypothetical protein